MKKFIILWILIIPAILYGQKDTTKLFEPSLIKADIDTLITNMKDFHPTFLNYYNANNLQSVIDSIKRNLNSPISSLDLFRIMQPIICIDGHTTLTYSGSIYPKIDNPFFPFKVIIYNDSLYIKENFSDNKSILKGSIISSINGVQSTTIIKNIIKYLPGERAVYKTKSLETQFHTYYRLVYGSFPEFTVVINSTEIKVKGAKNKDFHEPSKPMFELRFYDNDIAYIYKRNFKPPKDFIHFMDSAFREVSNRQIKYLIIDNLKGGGMTDLADSLLAYFTDKPYCLYETKMTKVSLLTKDFIAAKKSTGYFKGSYFIQEFPLHKSKYNNRFTGITYILTSPLSYSTGTCFPASAKCYKSAYIVGEETGQPLISNGDLNRFSLPNTQLTCYTSLSIIYMPCNNNDSKNGLLPDYKVTPSLEDLLNDKDYALEYSLKLIREKMNKE
ncbi:MAG: S41 family peptidase [Paludibacteraceae bacterium]